MERRAFFVSTALGVTGLGIGDLAAGTSGRHGVVQEANARKILIAGGGFRTPFIRYMAALTGKERPKLCYLPTASADRESGIIRWYEDCAPLDVVPSVQRSFISSSRMARSFEEVLLSVDGIVVSGGNTLNQQVIWKAHGIDEVLRQAWDRGIVLGGARARCVGSNMARPIRDLGNCRPSTAWAFWRAAIHRITTRKRIGGRPITT